MVRHVAENVGRSNFLELGGSGLGLEHSRHKAEALDREARRTTRQVVGVRSRNLPGTLDSLCARDAEVAAPEANRELGTMPEVNLEGSNDAIVRMKKKLGNMETEEGRRKGLQLTTRPNDLFVVTTPKAGTTWTQQVRDRPISSAQRGR